MKKSLALALALIMVMGCMSFAAAEGEQFTDFNGAVTLSKLTGGTEDITLTGNTFTHTYDLTDSQWEEAFYNCGEDNGIYLTARFTLPESAEKYFKSSYKADATDEQCMEILRNAAYMGTEGSFGVGLRIAGAAYDGNNIIITPEHCNDSVIIKWLDKDGNDHFHRVKFNLTVSRVGQGIKLTNASPANDRVKFDGREGAKGSYSDGTVRYMLADDFGYNTNGKTFTRLVRPSDNAVSATVNGENVNISETDNAIQLKVDARNDKSMTEAFTVCWLDEYGNTIKTERITISNCPTGAGVPWQKHWAPIDRGRIKVQDQRLISFFSYDNDNDNDNGKLLFEVTDSNAGSLNADMLNELSENKLIYEITPPAGAVKFRMSGQHSPLYDTYFADSTKQWLEKQPFEECVFENDAAKPYYYSFGKLFNRTKVEGVYVYTVNNTQVTFADIVIFQWYDEDENLIKGEYFYLVKNPYVRTVETDALSTDPKAPVTNPTLVASDSKGNEVLRAEIPLQEDVDQNSNTKYQYIKLTYIDKYTGLEVEPGTEGADVYLPYPEGMTYEQAQGYTFKLTHYTDENHVTHENVALEATQYGLKFNTTSFSPFLLEWKKAGTTTPASDKGSSGLSGVNITNLTNREISSYRLGGGMFSFRLGGSGAVIVTADGMVVTPDADGWYTVSAGARIVVDYPVMALPKTGDMPVWRWLPGL